MDDATAIVDALLAAAGLAPSAEERARFIADYPTIRGQLDELYAFDAGLEPAHRFSALAAYEALR